MSDRLVTVATFTLDHEAHLARNLLLAEGIPAVLGGEMSAALPLPDQVHLQVRAGDASRAVALLAEATLEKDWERRATRGVWTCSVCGDAVLEGATVCTTCATPRDAIRASREDVRAPRPRPAAPEGVQAPGGLSREPPPPPPAPPAFPLSPLRGPFPEEPPAADAPRRGPLTVFLVLAWAVLVLGLGWAVIFLLSR
jgi:hypothetical protein